MLVNGPPATLRTEPLTESERDVLSDLLTLAQHHDLVVVKAWRAVTDALINVRGRTANPLQIEVKLRDWEGEITDLHATIARAALEHGALYGQFEAGAHGVLIELQGEELETTLKPIFEESGIGHRFFRDRPVATGEGQRSPRS